MATTQAVAQSRWTLLPQVEYNVHRQTGMHARLSREMTGPMKRGLLRSCCRISPFSQGAFVVVISAVQHFQRPRVIRRLVSSTRIFHFVLAALGIAQSLDERRSSSADR